MKSTRPFATFAVTLLLSSCGSPDVTTDAGRGGSAMTETGSSDHTTGSDGSTQTSTTGPSTGSGADTSASTGAGGSTASSSGSAAGGSGPGGTTTSSGGTTTSSGGTTTSTSSTSSSSSSGAGGSVNQGNLPATTLHLAGDSTVMDYGAASAQQGWGQQLGQYFISKVTIDNRALGGASIQTFQSRWTGIVNSLKAGDFVMADFGINDSGTVAGRSVTTADFQKFMIQMNADVKGKQATFIIVTPSALQYWVGGKETNARLAPYVAVENSLGMTDHIPIDDLNARSLEFLNMIGQTAAMQIYINGDKAHFTQMGATQMAQFVASELKRIGNPLASYLK